MSKDPTIVRPNPWQWLRYVYTGTVPRKSATWVLHDATCRTWVLRHIARYFVIVTPLLVAVLIFLPISFSVRVQACVAAGGSILIGYLCFTTESLEHRVEKAGFPHGLAGQVREERSVAAQRAVVARGRARRDARYQNRP